MIRDNELLEELSSIVGLPVSDLTSLNMAKLQDAVYSDLERYVAKSLLQHQIMMANAPPRNPFTSWKYEELCKRPDPGWHVDGVLPVGVDVMLFGEAYSGKTLVVLDMLLSIANGIPWMGHATGAPQDVALVVGEGQRGVVKRITAWLAAHPGTTADRLRVFDVMPNIRSLAEVTYLVQSFVDEMEDHWPSVIAFDTWSRLAVGVNENDATGQTESIEMLDHFRAVFGLNASLIVVHHAGHNENGRPRGSSVFLGAFDTLIHVEPGTVKNTKQKDNEEFETLHFEVVKYAQSVSVEQVGAFAAGLEKVKELERQVIECVAEEPGIAVSKVARTLHKRRAVVSSAVDAMVVDGRLTQVISSENQAKLLYVPE